MNARYPIKVVLTSLALATVPLGAGPAQPSRPTCAELRRLYSPRLLRRARAELLLALARQHAARAALASAVTRGALPVSRLTEPLPAASPTHDPQDPRLKHLLALLATSC